MNNLVKSIFRRSLDAMKPGQLVRKRIILSGDSISFGDSEFDLSKVNGIYLFAAGKASVEMATAAADILGERLVKGLVISPYRTGISSEKLTVLKASHPVPDRHSMEAGEGLLNFLKLIPRESLVINCLSGGASALLSRPGEGISITDLNRSYELLNNSGARIREINTVRKHFSRVKGGQLLRHIDPSVSLIDLIISDVPDDDPAVIGSGPTTPDPSTFQDAYHILSEYELLEKIPESVRNHVEDGLNGVVPETVKPGDNPLKGHQQYIIGSARKFAEKTGEFLEEEGYMVKLAGEAYNEDVRQVSNNISAGIRSVVQKGDRPPVALVFYGESTVHVKGGGKGGRNQELALWGALSIPESEQITWLSAGTDGIDGPTDAAGAVVDGNTIARAKEKGLDPEEYLENNDTYYFHQKAGTLLKTGPTGNNLMDIQIVLID